MTPDPQDPERMLAEHFARRLRELRARHGFTQDRIAQELGVHESAVSRWENGSRSPGNVDLVRLSALFRVSIDYLLGQDEQHAAPGSALVDCALLERLEAAPSVAAFDQLIEQHADQTVWLPVPEGAVLLPVAEAMRRTRRVAEKHKQSRFVDRLFRPRG